MSTVVRSTDKVEPLYQRMLSAALDTLHNPQFKPMQKREPIRALAGNLAAVGVPCTKTAADLRQTLSILTQPAEWFAISPEGRRAVIDALADFIEVTR